ncbi:NAD(P)H-hydrate dehydratase [Pseudomonas violetae]|jgi:ADP-dependent NAD(P)H-hydrate dehydratase / NAD(P)H-hydrate epimerase|uniref:Bifunctional NAD(P)H-hydrate repair enzyme n=1 Tax=Pseudomonas violetae TaxID=2915813 RepID=A0ABT0ETT1_9PSED|nr:NAD(P)H-hydrate dehydratase [Pseudomonas violetae]MCK1789142.1 NAD(P)H-hydrate dehydratase [Pseudomonas violetae]
MNMLICEAALNNRQTAVLTVRQMEDVDRLSVAAGVTSYELMANAGAAIAHQIERHWTPRPVVVLCGPGNNGGDGFVTAHVLAEAGWPVRVAMLGSRFSLKDEARHHARRWQGDVEALSPSVLEGAELIVDALFGAGLGRPLEGQALATLAAASEGGVPIIAIDMPSGVMGDTGEAVGAVPAALTITFLCKKPGHLLLPGRDLCGEVIVVDIGTPKAVVDSIAPRIFENSPAVWLASLPGVKTTTDKHSRGHALIFGGYPMTGAARMAARGAARAGAGLTTIAVPEIALSIYAAALDSIMVRPWVTPEDIGHLLNGSRFSAWLIGSGAGVDKETFGHVLAMLASGRPTVLDADAITAFQDEPGVLDRAINGPCVLTPHEGEFRRVFDAAGDKLTRTRAAAFRCGAVVVLKGSDTVIAAPDGTAVINANAPPTLATAGSGDVLSGIILGLLAQGMPAFASAAAGVWLHGEAAAEFGPGLLADDLPNLLPGVLRRLHEVWLPVEATQAHVSVSHSD